MHGVGSGLGNTFPRASRRRGARVATMLTAIMVAVVPFL
ncbi:MAG: hypothetical protein QOK39_1214, partial [Acidimicrobiaceae bacterium]|nr:hypothetical protein [Acidimicrobiaceae bacterium]